MLVRPTGKALTAGLGVLNPGSKTKLSLLDLLSLCLAYWVLAARPVVGADL
jgi:hypothetical protein